MPTFKCRQCPSREFNTRIGLHQHYRQAAQHPFCVRCDKYCNTQEGLDAHNAIEHPPFECTICRQIFQTQSSLEDHYRGKAATIHPNCSRCGKGFFDARALDEASPSPRLLRWILMYLQHFKEAHPLEQCPCGRKIFVEDLPHHYTESVHHPTCLPCVTGFKDDAAYNAHGVVKHADSRCNHCVRQFRSPKELQEHFATSDFHPKCLKCGKVGFRDDASLNEHLAEAHVLAPPVEVALAPPFRDLLAIEAPPVAGRHPRMSLPPPGEEANGSWTSKVGRHPISRKSLPPPGKEANAIWTSTKNRVVPTAPVAPVDALGRPGKVDASTPVGRNPANVATQQNRSHVGFRSWTELPTLWTDESFKSRSWNGSTSSVFSDHTEKTLSPQSSMSSFSSFVESGGRLFYWYISLTHTVRVPV
ncbi:hypothetical protein MSAN_01063000 [Mycena sanguinolenta]|uniref:C2H2-type domain-containing protein n=1 Tax=Mycena sanguinolenta TaxID=230812 RepID=A0A8H6YPY2_9AGAR|nr:hypothetical protein MSAN_01063000 [Mycena sanguinolenta]